jgi:hypothetical protein
MNYMSPPVLRYTSAFKYQEWGRLIIILLLIVHTEFQSLRNQSESDPIQGLVVSLDGCWQM